MKDSVIAIDPGNDTGWACFVSGVLLTCGTDRYPIFFHDPTFSRGARVIIEKPQGRERHSKGSQNQIIDLAIKAGELSGFYKKQPWVKLVTLVTPVEWKGSVPKEIHNRRVLAKLTEQELALLPVRPRARNPYDHNTVDAIGLGLWLLKR